MGIFYSQGSENCKMAQSQEALIEQRIRKEEEKSRKLIKSREIKIDP